MGTEPVASVVVPTHARPEVLRTCLSALRAQTVPLELIVAQDGARNAAEVDAVCRAAGATLVRIAPAGVSAARNAGIARASSPFVLMTDDDCEPAPEWAEGLIAALDAGADLVAGPVINADGRDRFAAATQAIHDHLAGPAFATPNNVGCRRSALAAVPFDEHFTWGGEDRDWCLRMERAGFELRHVPAAEVLHRQGLTYRTFVRKQVAYGRGSARFRRRHGGALERAGWYGALARRGFAVGTRVGLLVLLAQFAGAWGALTWDWDGPSA